MKPSIMLFSETKDRHYVKIDGIDILEITTKTAMIDGKPHHKEACFYISAKGCKVKHASYSPSAADVEVELPERSV